MIKLSCIIVSYNENCFIREAVDSCLNQKCSFEYEIIIGDDGSEDGSIETIKQYVKKFPKTIDYFVMDRNSRDKYIIPSVRVSNIIKTAIKKARGEYLTVISADDLLLDPNKFEKQVSFLENNKNYSSCYTDYKKFGESQKDQVFGFSGSVNEDTFWGRHYVHISCFLFKKGIEDYLLDRFCDDTGLIFSILKMGKSKHIETLSFGYRQRNNSIMHKVDPLELVMIELLLYQDILNTAGFEKSSLSRFYLPMKYALLNRNLLNNSKYKKYLISGDKYPNNLLRAFMQYDSLNLREKRMIRKRIIKAKWYSMIYYIRFLKEVSLNKIIEG